MLHIWYIEENGSTMNIIRTMMVIQFPLGHAHLKHLRLWGKLLVPMDVPIVPSSSEALMRSPWGGCLHTYQGCCYISSTACCCVYKAWRYHGQLGKLPYLGRMRTVALQVIKTSSRASQGCSRVSGNLPLLLPVFIFCNPV